MASRNGAPISRCTKVRNLVLHLIFYNELAIELSQVNFAYLYKTYSARCCNLKTFREYNFESPLASSSFSLFRINFVKAKQYETFNLIVIPRNVYRIFSWSRMCSNCWGKKKKKLRYETNVYYPFFSPKAQQLQPLLIIRQN